MDASDWNARYDTSELIWKGEPNQFLPPEVVDLTPGTAVDLACGEGRNASSDQCQPMTAIELLSMSLSEFEEWPDLK